MNDRELLHILSKSFNNRKSNEQISDAEQLIIWIKEDLLDQWTHPRLRKDRHERFFLATRKIIESEFMKEDEKIHLLQKYIQQLNELRE